MTLRKADLTFAMMTTGTGAPKAVRAGDTFPPFLFKVSIEANELVRDDRVVASNSARLHFVAHCAKRSCHNQRVSS